MNQPTMLCELLARTPAESIALEFGELRLSYAQLREQIESVAQGLRNQGLHAGDVLGIWLPNTPRWLVLHLACASLGVSTLSLNLKLGVKEIASFIDRSGAKALAFDRRIVDAGASSAGPNASDENQLSMVWQQHAGSLHWLLDASVDSLGQMARSRPNDTRAAPVWSDWNTLMHASPEGSEVKPDLSGWPCIILSSSGTTSLPKLIVHAQSNIALHVQDVAPGFDVQAGDRTLLALPMCGAFGYTAAMMTLAAGATLVLHEMFEPALAARALSEQPITHMFGTNDMVEKLIAPLPDDWRPRALKFVGHANFVPGLDELPARAQGLGMRMVGCFGMSEIFALFAHQAVNAELPRRAQSGGIPVTASVQVRARNLETGTVCATMEPGELEFRGPYMMKEYLGNPEATANAFTDDGFLRSGDLGYVNGDGGFTHISRLGDVLRIGGFLVNPAEIEEAVLAVSGASACQVVAVQAAGSSRPVAFVIVDGTQVVDEALIKDQLLRQIAKYKVPIRIIRMEGFPYTMGPNGKKVKRNELRDLAQSMLDKESTT
ncbi:AMP-binding protein [Diaphorobacter sp. HDW4A]|uniref:AMP-binding protein n=1 Tax=Diaphorobacter sp. HDW4A TaxID=2714924 RepID=UPI00140E4C7F|nr:AMP-binding protein [Diaphorobacter sp. HDW4A]QIL80976.1 AMP-binding protein [Diaphorobacter sp. HDW4A]